MENMQMFDNQLSEEKGLTCIFCSRLWCKYYQHGSFQAPGEMSLNMELESCAISFHEPVQVHSSTLLRADRARELQVSFEEQSILHGMVDMTMKGSCPALRSNHRTEVGQIDSLSQESESWVEHTKEQVLKTNPWQFLPSIPAPPSAQALGHLIYETWIFQVSPWFYELFEILLIDFFPLNLPRVSLWLRQGVKQQISHLLIWDNVYLNSCSTTLSPRLILSLTRKEMARKESKVI